MTGDEKETNEDTSVSGTVTAADPDAEDVLAYSIEGGTGPRFGDHQQGLEWVRRPIPTRRIAIIMDRIDSRCGFRRKREFGLGLRQSDGEAGE